MLSLIELISQINYKIYNLSNKIIHQQMKAPLIPKGNNFNQNHQILVLRVQSIRRKNDQYQRLVGAQIDSGMAQQILQQKSIMDNEIEETKKYIQEIERISKQPQHRNKLKETKKQFQKQASRYKQISEALMEKSVIRAEMRDSLNRRSNGTYRARMNQQKYKEVQSNRESSQIAKQQQLDIDYTMEHGILMDRKKQLIKAQQQIYRINEVHKDMSQLVNQQGGMIDIIHQEMMKAVSNVQASNQQLTEAAQLQKKSRKKCIIIVLVIVLIVIALLGIYLIIDPSKQQSQSS